MLLVALMGLVGMVMVMPFPSSLPPIIAEGIEWTAQACPCRR